MREVGVGIKRDVGDAVTIAHEIAMVLEMILHHGERAVTFLHPVLERVLLQLAAALDQRQPEIRRADIGAHRRRRDPASPGPKVPSGLLGAPGY